MKKDVFMTLKKVCGHCGNQLKTNTVNRVGIQDGYTKQLLLANCKHCEETRGSSSTYVIASRQIKTKKAV